MHPSAPPEPLRFPSLRAPQISVAAEHGYELNQKAARVTESPLGFFGWSDDMFFWQAGQKSTTLRNFLFQRSRMQSILVECTAPAAVVYMTVAGTLTGLNKVDPATQLKRTIYMEGLDPAIRGQ